MSANVWLYIAIGSYIIAALLAVTAVILFFKLNIKAVINDLNGKTVAKEVKNIRETSNEKIKKNKGFNFKTTKTPMLNKKEANQVNIKEADNDESTTVLKHDEESTTVLNNNKESTTVLSQNEELTTVLNQNEEATTVLNNEGEETTLLSGEQKNSSFVEDESVIVIHTDEEIK